MNKTISYNQTEHTTQDYCITFSHLFHGNGARMQNSFVIKGAGHITTEKALTMINILFPERGFTDIEIVSIENDVNTLTPTEYEFIRGKLNDLYQSSMRTQEIRIREGKQTTPLAEDKYDKYLNSLINKMTVRMNQFPTYHT